MNDEKITSSELIKINPYSEQEDTIVKSIVDEDDPEKLKQLITIFNNNQVKRNTLKIKTLNDISDKIINQVAERISKKSNEFSNSDLLNYMQITDSAIEKASKKLDSIDSTPLIQINQQNNVSIDNQSLPKDSRDKILDYVNNILKAAKNNILPQDNSDSTTLDIQPLLEEEDKND